LSTCDRLFMKKKPIKYEQDRSLPIEGLHTQTLCWGFFCDCHKICLVSISSHLSNYTAVLCYIGNVEIVHPRFCIDEFHLLKFESFVFCRSALIQLYMEQTIREVYIWILFSKFTVAKNSKE
jgi:hypothetical protein